MARAAPRTEARLGRHERGGARKRAPAMTGAFTLFISRRVAYFTVFERHQGDEPSIPCADRHAVELERKAVLARAQIPHRADGRPSVADFGSEDVCGLGTFATLGLPCRSGSLGDAHTQS